MFSIISLLLRYLFILLIYLFMFGIIRMIYLDIKGIRSRSSISSTYLKLINRREDLPFKVEENYPIKSALTIGRSNKNDIVIKDPFLSKKHVNIYWDKGNHFIEDLESSNGTYVNDERIYHPIKLVHGDTVKIGQVSFLFVEVS